MLKQTINILKKAIKDYKTVSALDNDYPVNGLIVTEVENKMSFTVFNIDDKVKSFLPTDFDIVAFINKDKPCTFCGYGNNTHLILFGDLEKNLVPLPIIEVKGYLFT